MLGFLPWEKWLPPYIFGSLLCLGSICVLVFARDPSWWQMVLTGFGVVLGGWGTWVWFSAGRNIFDLSGRKTK
jgi:hypothetical protein